MGTEREFDALASEAIASSEAELFSDAMGREDPVQDESGDRSLEDMGSGLEGQHEAGDGDENEDETRTEPEAAKAEGEDDENVQRDEKGRFQPPDGKTETPAERGLRNALTEERNKVKAAETARTELEARLAALEARLTQPQPQPAPAPQPVKEPVKDEAPDRWTEPEKYDQWFKEQILKEVQAPIQSQEQRRIAWSFQEAKAKHGDDFQKAYEIVNRFDTSDPVAKRTVDEILQSPNPGERLVTWHRQQQAMKDIGNDPAAYKAKLEAETRDALMKDPEFRKQLLADLKAEASGANGGSPRTATQLPPSLNTAGRTLTRAPTGGTSDRDVFEEVMS